MASDPSRPGRIVSLYGVPADVAFDCVVSDCDTPGTEGIDFPDAVRAEYPDLPFVLFTGGRSEEVASEAISAGVTDSLEEAGWNGAICAADKPRAQRRLPYRSQRRAAELERVRGTVFETDRVLVGADTRAEVGQLPRAAHASHSSGFVS